MPEFVCYFQMDGSTYSMNIIADDMADAVRRVCAIRESLELQGELGGTIPADDSIPRPRLYDET